MIDYAQRRRRLQEAMGEQGIDLLAVAPGENMFYLLGYHPHPDERPCYLMLTPEKTGFLVPELNATQVQEHVDMPLETYADAEGPAKPLGRLAAELGFDRVRTVALDETMRTDFTLLLLERLPGADPVVATGILGAMRMRKEPAELELIQKNAEVADRAMQAAFQAIRAGATELEIAEAARRTFEAGQVDRVNFTIIGSGPNGAFPHHHTGWRAVRAGEAVVIDIGARMAGYNSDITRMGFLGDPDEEYLEVHQVVEEAVQAALEAVKPGAPAHAVDRAARNVITAAGYGEFFTHRTGHGLGLNGHEPPYMTGVNDLPLEEGMVFSIEPGIYLPGKFGVRLEEIVAVTATGPRIFSRLGRGVYRVSL